jgi:hypothetical protein
VSQTLKRVANVDMGNARFRLIRRGEQPKTVLIFAPPFPVYSHHPRACSIIPCIGFSSPRAPKHRKVGKFECHRRKAWLRARRCACSLPWPPWIAAIAPNCVLTTQAWGFHLGPARSLPGPYAFTGWPSCLRSLQTWTSLCRGPCNDKPLPHGDENLGAQLHLALR